MDTKVHRRNIGEKKTHHIKMLGVAIVDEYIQGRLFFLIHLFPKFL